MHRCRLLVLLALSACASLSIQRKPKPDDTIVAAADDGSQYVRVDGGALSSSAGLTREWNRAAEKACDGEYMVLSDAGFERKKAGFVVSRTHEGYVRCIVGDPDRTPPDGDVPGDQRLGSRR